MTQRLDPYSCHGVNLSTGVPSPRWYLGPKGGCRWGGSDAVPTRLAAVEWNSATPIRQSPSRHGAATRGAPYRLRPAATTLWPDRVSRTHHQHDRVGVNV